MDYNQSVNKIIEYYSRFVPQEFIKLLGKENIINIELGDHIEMSMTILFSDIRDFTTLSEGMTPKENFAFINSYLERMEPVITKFEGIIDKYIGDAIMALFPKNADTALMAAIEMLKTLESFNRERKASQLEPIKIGIGINTGLMMLGIIGGKHRIESTVISDAVNLASRIESMTKNYGVPILISEHTYYNLKDPSSYSIRFIDRVKVKGKGQGQSVYEVFDGDPPSIIEGKIKTKAIFEEALAHYHLKKVDKAKELLFLCLEEVPYDTVAKVYLERCERFIETGVHESSGETGIVVHWDDSFAVGHPTIDHQHRSLFEHASKLVSAMERADDYVELNDLIDFLGKYVIEHFYTEEKIMLDVDYPFLDLQVTQHRQFTEYFNLFKEEIKRDFNEHRIFLLFKAQVLIIDWLINHTTKLDMHLRRFLGSKN